MFGSKTVSPVGPSRCLLQYDGERNHSLSPGRQNKRIHAVTSAHASHVAQHTPQASAAPEAPEANGLILIGEMF